MVAEAGMRQKFLLCAILFLLAGPVFLLFLLYLTAPDARMRSSSVKSGSPLTGQCSTYQR